VSDVSNFLPEDDVEYLQSKCIKYQLRSETVANGTIRRGVVFPEFCFEGRLYRVLDGVLAPVSQCELLVVIPKGYSTAKLDSFYTFPHLKRPDGTDPDRATGQEEWFGRTRQFWSRHLADGEWRQGIDGLETYLHYVRVGLKAA
jgi:hypothetical protein